MWLGTAAIRAWKIIFDITGLLKTTILSSGVRFIFVGNKAKGRISNWVFQENKARQIFGKTKNISYLLICTRTFAYQRVRYVRSFRKIWLALFSWNTRYYRRVLCRMAAKTLHVFRCQRKLRRKMLAMESSIC